MEDVSGENDITAQAEAIVKDAAKKATPIQD
jgi:hypothetical protein